MSDFAPGDEPGPAPVPAPAPRRRLLPKILIAVAALLVVALVGGSVYAYTINRSVTKNISRQDNLPADSGATPRPARDPQVTGALNYVVLGSDSRDPVNSGNGRSDSIMVVHLNDKRNKAYIISFPRDMYVEIPGHGKNKINAAFSLGGAKLTVSTLENLLDVRMDHVALIDFEGFVKLTESLGGVEVKNTTAFTSHGYTYPKGTISIKGEEALWFVRERHHLPGGDLARAANQRNVLKAIIEKGLSRTTMADPVRYLSFVSGLAQHVTVDKSLTDSEIRKTALSVNVKADDVQLLQAPLSGFGMTSDGQSIDIVNQKRLKALASALKKDKMGTYVEKYPKG